MAPAFHFRRLKKGMKLSFTNQQTETIHEEVQKGFYQAVRRWQWHELMQEQLGLSAKLLAT